MEFILIVIVVVLLIAGFKAMQFANFKSELMHALAEEGVSFAVGNSLYTRHATLVAKQHAEGLSPVDIAHGLVRATVVDVADLPIEVVRDIYALSREVAVDLRGGVLTQSSANAFVTTDFMINISAFLTSIKAHYGLEVEKSSGGDRFTSALSRMDLDAIAGIRNEMLTAVNQLSDDDAAGFCFHFFWPELHRKVRTGV